MWNPSLHSPHFPFSRLLRSVVARRRAMAREVTSSGESVSDQPIEKTPKIEESTPSPTAIIRSYCASSCDLEFEQKLMQAYEKRRAAAEAKYRARNQLDSNREIVDSSKKEPEKKVQNSESTRENDALKLELVELRRREDKAKNVKDALTRENHQLKLEMEELRSKDEKTKILENKFTREISALKEELKAAKTKGKRDVDELSAEIAVLHKTLGDSTRKEKDAIDRERNLALHISELKEELEKAKKKGDDREIEQKRNIKVLKEELDFVRRAEADTNHREFELMRVINGLKEELDVEENKREGSSKKELDLTTEIEALKAEIVKLKKSEYQTAEIVKSAMMRRNSALQEELNNTKKQKDEDNMKYTTRIKYLERKLAQFESQQQVQPPQQFTLMQLPSVVAAMQPIEQPQLSQPVSEALDSTLNSYDDEVTILMPPEKKIKERTTPPRIHERGDSINMFQLCRSNTKYSISVDVAIRQIHDEFEGKKYKEVFKSWKKDELKLKCSVCEKKVRKYKVFDHILSSEHIEKVRGQGAAVSQAALQHWLREVQQAAAAPSDVEAAVAADASDADIVPL